MKRNNLVSLKVYGLVSDELEARIIRQMESDAERHILEWQIVKIHRRDNFYTIWFEVTTEKSKYITERCFAHVFDNVSDGVKLNRLTESM